MPRVVKSIGKAILLRSYSSTFPHWAVTEVTLEPIVLSSARRLSRLKSGVRLGIRIRCAAIPRIPGIQVVVWLPEGQHPWLTYRLALQQPDLLPAADIALGIPTGLALDTP